MSTLKRLYLIIFVICTCSSWAVIQNYDFSVPADYTVSDATKVQVTGTGATLSALIPVSADANTLGLWHIKDDTTGIRPAAIDTTNLLQYWSFDTIPLASIDPATPGVAGLWHFDNKVDSAGSYPSSGAVSRWRFDDNSGSTLTDIIGPNSGTLQPGAGGSNTTTGDMWQASGGKLGGALELDGTDDRVELTEPSHVSTHLTTGTMTAWIKTSGPGSGWRGIMVKQSAYGMFLKDNTFAVYDWSTASERNSGVNLVDNAWHHVAVTFVSGSANGTNLYIDGVLRFTTTITVSNQNEGLTFGAGSNPGTTQNFNGFIDDARLFNRVLEANEIATLAATATEDISGNALHGAPIGASVTTSGKSGNAYSFDGSNDYILVPDAAALEGMANFSMEAWIKPTVLGSYNTIVNKRYCYLLTVDNTGKLQVYFGTGAGWGSLTVTSAGAVTTGSWYHIAMTYNGTTVKTYINGIQDANTGAKTGTIATNTDPVEIGYRALEASQPFSGTMDEVVIYHQALTDSAIAVHAGVSVPDSSLCRRYGVASGPVSSAGRFGRALTFDGTNDKVDRPGTSDLALTTYSVSGWFKTSDKSGYKAISARSISSADRNWWITIWQAGAGTHPDGSLVWRTSSGGAINVDLDCGYDVADNAWHHFAVVLNGTATARLYLDGVRCASMNNPGVPNTPSVAAGVGHENGTRYFNGQIDEIAVFGRALNETEIARLAGACVNDSSGNAYHGTRVKKPALIAGRVDSGFSFNGSTQYLNLGSSGGLNAAWSALTVDAWVNATNVAPAVGRTIVSKGAAAGNNNFNLSLEPDGRIRFWFSNVNLAYSAAPITAGTWYHVAGVWNGTQSIVYVNNTAGTPVANTPAVTASGSPVYAGDWNLDANWYWNGKIDEVRVSNTARTSFQSTLYATDNPYITQKDSLQFGLLQGFATTETLNGGSNVIQYVVSTDNGATWRYWTGAAWTATNGTTYGESSTAAQINTNIGTLPTGIYQFKWRAFVHSGGTDNNLQLQNVQVTYVPNMAPTVALVSAGQRTDGSRILDVVFNTADADNVSHTVSLEYSLNNGAAWSAATQVSGDAGAGVAKGNGKALQFDLAAQGIAQEISTFAVRLTIDDGMGANATDRDSLSGLTIDTKAPYTVVSDLALRPESGFDSCILHTTYGDVNPNTLSYTVSLNGAMKNSQAGVSNSTAPADLTYDFSATLDGDDAVDSILTTVTDDFGNTTHDTLVAVSTKGIKPYTPAAPWVGDFTATTVRVKPKPGLETGTTEYAIHDATTGQYVQLDSTLNAGEVWRTLAAWDTVKVKGLLNPSTHFFRLKSRNPVDNNESDFGPSAKAGGEATLNFIRILTSTDGNRANEYATGSYTADNGSFTLYAAGFDVDSAFLGNQSVTWGVTDSGLAAGLAGRYGVSVIFTPTQTGSGRIFTDSTGILNDSTGIVQVTPGALSYVKIRSAAGGAGSEVGVLSLLTTDTLPLYAAGYDADNNYISDVSVTWTQTLANATLSAASGTNTNLLPHNACSGIVTADHATATDDVTGVITVSAIVDSLDIRSARGNNGSPVDNPSYTADNKDTLFAAGYDAIGQYLGDFTVAWSGSGTGNDLSQVSGDSVVFSPALAGTNGSIIAVYGAGLRDTVKNITVTTGVLNYVKVRDAAGGSGGVVTTVSMTTLDTLSLYSAGYDADNNYISDIIVTWTQTLPSATLLISSGTSTKVVAQNACTGTVIADHATATDGVTGVITVTAAVSRIDIRSARSNGGASVDGPAYNADNLDTLFAAGYDALDHYLGDVTVAWSGTGSGNYLSLVSGDSVAFNPTLAGLGGSIIAVYSSGVRDTVANIAVTPGAISYVIIRNAAGGGGGPVTTVSMTTLDTLNLYAAGYDADNNYISDVTVNWTKTLPNATLLISSGTSTKLVAQNTCSGIVSADHATATDGATGTLTVTAAVSRIDIRSARNNGGASVDEPSYTADAKDTLFTAGYDALDHYLGDVTVAWSGTGAGNYLSQVSGDSVIFDATLIGTGGRIMAAYGAGTRDTVKNITVTPGALFYVKIRSASGGLGSEVGAVSMTTVDTLDLFAAGYDLDNNFVNDVSVTWGRNVSHGTLLVGSGSSTRLTVSNNGAGKVWAAHASALPDTTGLVSVTGNVTRIDIRSARNNGGSSLDSIVITTDGKDTVFAAAYDSLGHYLGDSIVTWSGTAVANALNTVLSDSAVLSPLVTGLGRIFAQYRSIRDSIGLVRVLPGAMARLAIRNDTLGGGSEVGTLTIGVED
ncbi:MAG: LamG-like jellyroll fold domain-containing protein, partial [Fibrobacterota bacterium]